MELLVTYMELRTQPSDAAVRVAPSVNLNIEAERLSVADYLALYHAIGAPLTWDQRLRMPEVEVAQFLSAASTRTFLLREEGRPVGLCEFDAVEAADIELTHFGLIPAAYGRRLGPFLLANACTRSGGKERGAYGSTPTRMIIRRLKASMPGQGLRPICRGWKRFRIEPVSCLVSFREPRAPHPSAIAARR